MSLRPGSGYSGVCSRLCSCAVGFFVVVVVVVVVTVGAGVAVCCLVAFFCCGAWKGVDLKDLGGFIM